MLNRRALEFSALAATCLALAPGRAVASVQVGVIGSPLQGQKTADCAALRALDASLAAEAALSLTMPPSELNAEVTKTGDVLATRQTIVAKAQQAAHDADVKLVRQALYSTLDYVLAACILRPMPWCIGTVYGVKIVGGTADALIQGCQAPDGASQRSVLTAYIKDRGVMFRDMAADLKPRDAHKAAQRALNLIRSATQKLGKAGGKALDAQDDLNGAVAALADLNKAFGWALASEANYRVFRQQHFEAQRWLPKLLLGRAGNDGCAAKVGADIGKLP